MKKVIVILCLTLIFSNLFSACVSTKKEEGTEESLKMSTGQNEDSNFSSPGTFPIAKDKITLKFLTRENALIADISTNEMTKYMEEKTNIHIDWDVSANLSETKAVILASGDYPDVFFSAGITKDEETIYGSQGAFLALNDLIEDYSVELKKIFSKVKYFRPSITTADGNIYSLPMVSETYHGYFGNKMWVNTKWLNQLDMKPPTTTEEFYQMLISFKNNDPNNNSTKDEIPLSALPGPQYYSVETFLMCPFITDAGLERFVQPYVKGNLDIISNKPEFRNGLRYLNKLYKEDLIDPETFTQDSKILKTKCENNFVGAFPAHTPSAFTDINGEQYKNFDPIAPLVGPEGVQSVGIHATSTTTGYYVITNKCKYPEAAFRWADWLFSEEALHRSINGVEGVNWRKAEPGELGINGEPGKWKKLATTTGVTQNNHWAQMGPSYRSSPWRLSEVAVQDIYDPLGLETRLYQATKLYEGLQKEPIFNPGSLGLYIGVEYAAELAKLKESLVKYQDESIARFITGDLDIEGDWDRYVKTLDDMGLKRYLELYQKAYDDKYKGTGLDIPGLPEEW